ncbi:hypothetical protein HDU98_009655 [Podochytrium sp. JEL0797]|nr:hypothetical protein HDU98_009655 [Podochytrium sp. JEL0797]
MDNHNNQPVPPLEHEVVDKQLRKQSVPETPFMFHTPIMTPNNAPNPLQGPPQSLQSQAQQQPADFNGLDQAEYYRRMSLPAHLAPNQITPLVNYSNLQSNLMNSFNPYMIQQFEDGASPIAGSMIMEGMNMFDSGNMYYSEVQSGVRNTPVPSPLVPYQKIPAARPSSDASSPPGSPDGKKNSKGTSDGKKNRFKATEAELPILSAVFEKNPFPSAILRKKLADRLGLESKQIQFWFQNRRATLKINGIHVIKPKKTNTPSASFKAKPDLSPLTAGNPYFFVEHNASKPEELNL